MRSLKIVSAVLMIVLSICCCSSKKEVAGPGDPAGGTFDPPEITASCETDTLNSRRIGHTATLLQDGRVLVVGGVNSSDYYMASCELYDPETQTWEYTASLAVGRHSHTATLLHDGRVLVTGGDRDLSSTSTYEIYDPETENWASFTGAEEAMQVRRRHHSATLLSDGRVIIIGGFGGGLTGVDDFIRSYEFFYPEGDSFPDFSRDNVTDYYIHYPRSGHEAILLGDGRVLVTGGENDESTGYNEAILYTSELYDPAAVVPDPWDYPARYHFSDGPDMSKRRMGHTMTLLDDGRVLIAGGRNNTIDFTAQCELFDPVSDTWSTTGSMSDNRKGHAAVLLDDGRVWVAGDYINQSIETYDPSTGNWTTGGSIFRRRKSFPVVKFSNGVVMIIGGDYGGSVFSVERYHNSCELHLP